MAIYDNIRMLDMNGNFLCYCDRKRFHWYVSRKLAVEVNENTFQLTFQAKGEGDRHNKVLSQPKPNHCIVCGCTSNLTKHHIVPIRYRRYLPLELKSKRPYDILLLCEEHHTAYELTAPELNKILVNAGFNIHSLTPPKQDKELFTRNSLLKLLLQDKVPMLRKNEICQQLNIPYDVRLINSLLTSIPKSKAETKPFVYSLEEGKIIEKLARQHFLDTMKPQHLPQGWTI